MNRFRAALLAVVVAFAAMPALRADDEPPTVNEQAEDYAKEFKKGYKKMSMAQLVEGVDKLVAYFNDEAVDDEDVKDDILDSMTRACTVRDPVVVAHTMKKFADLKLVGEFNLDVARVVGKTLDRELAQKVPNDTVYEAALETLGKLHVENRAVTKQLTDLLTHKDYPVIARAARAIAGYAGAGGETRKELFEEILKASEGTYSSAQANDNNAKRKWNVIGDDVMDALAKLSNVNYDSPILYRQWWGDAKKENWDREK